MQPWAWENMSARGDQWSTSKGASSTQTTPAHDPRDKTAAPLHFSWDYPRLLCSCLWYERRVLLMSRAAADTTADGDMQQLGTACVSTWWRTCASDACMHTEIIMLAWLILPNSLSSHEQTSKHIHGHRYFYRSIRSSSILHYLLIGG